MARRDTAALSPVCAYVSERTGSLLSEHQIGRLRQVLQARLAGRTELKFLEHLRSPHGEGELAELMASISVHKTDLFRDPGQLEAFVSAVLKPLAREERPLRLWSAGCATGEEVATLLILLAEAGAHPESTVLGTDISDSALKEAQKLSFHRDLMVRVPESLRARYFRPDGNRFALEPTLRARARFHRHNLMDHPYPMPPAVGKPGAGFDAIFCRNVMIYFTESAFESVVASLASRLEGGGVLVLAAAEPILKPVATLEVVRHQQAFFYARKRPGEPPRKAPATVPAALPGWPGIDLQLTPPRGMAKPFPEAPPRASPPMPPPPPTSPDSDPRQEAEKLFGHLLEEGSSGEVGPQTEEGLRRCLYLDPHFAQARYLLAMLLEQRGAAADANSEYRRALAALTEGKSRAIPFFLNNERLKTACQIALRRLGYR
jgi:chemotaxis protein methyltransferase CheR